jgi:hypothetical protein
VTSSLQSAAAFALITILVALSALHVAWALRKGPSFAGVVPTDGDRPLFVPSAGASLAVALALAAAALLCAMRAGFAPLPVPAWIARIGVWGVALAFAARAFGERRYVGFFKRVRGTLFARRDTRFYSPLCVLIAALACALALRAH